MFVGQVTSFSMMIGLPNFSSDKPSNTPNDPANAPASASFVPAPVDFPKGRGSLPFFIGWLTNSASTNRPPTPEPPAHSSPATAAFVPSLPDFVSLGSRKAAWQLAPCWSVEADSVTPHSPLCAPHLTASAPTHPATTTAPPA